MSVLDFLKPAPYREEIQDGEVVKKNYKYWRLRIFFSMYIGYAFYYLTRKSFTFAMPALKADLGLSMYELGLLGSVLHLSYGASKFVSGVIGDKSNPRYFMSLGLIMTGIFNLLFGLSSTFWAFAILWGLNGWFQGWGWPGCAKLLTHWYSQSERGRWWSFWNTSHNLGGAIIPIIAAMCAAQFGWRYAMYVPGVLCIAIGLFLINRLRDTPQSLGLPSIEKFRSDYSSNHAKEDHRTHLSAREILFKYVLTNHYVWVLAFAYFFIYIIRTALNDWSMMYLVESKGYSTVAAGFCVCWFEIGGLFGSLAAGWLSDRVFGARRNPVNVIFTVGALFIMLSFWLFPHQVAILDSAFQFFFGFFIFGPQMLIGMAAAELSHKKAAASTTGFAGCFAYFGAALAGGPLGAIVKSWGWNSLFITLISCAIFASLLLLPLWSVKGPKALAEEPVPS